MVMNILNHPRMTSKVEELTSDNSHSCQLDTIYLHYTLLTEEESVLCSLNLNPKKVMKKTKVFHA